MEKTQIKIWCISDTHGWHEQLIVPKDIDMCIHAGDFSNSKSPAMNSNEAALFLNWFDKLKIKHKVLICGNHDTSIEAKLINPRDFKSIIYLEHEYVEVVGLKIFGSPYTLSFNDWSFNVKHNKLERYWKQLPDKLDLLITHGPPKGVLDLSYNTKHILEYCGDKSLLNRVREIKPRFHIFGHIHDNKDCYNQGVFCRDEIKYMNVSCVKDDTITQGLSSNGIIIQV